MALSGRIQLTQVAWNFSGSTRVFKVPELLYAVREDKQEFEAANGDYVIDVVGLWFSFEVRSEYFLEQVSGTATDRIDILNALKGTDTVLFYPDYEFQPSISYAVKSAAGNLPLLQTRRGLFKKSQTILMRTNRITNYPNWLEYR